MVNMVHNNGVNRGDIHIVQLSNRLARVSCACVQIVQRKQAK